MSLLKIIERPVGEDLANRVYGLGDGRFGSNPNDIASQFPDVFRRAEEQRRQSEQASRQSHMPDLPADGTDPRWHDQGNGNG